MSDFVHTVINYVVQHWEAITALFGGGAGLSVILQVLLHKLHIDSKKLAYTLIHVLSIGGAAAAFYLEHASALPTYASLVIAAQTVHRFLISPVYNSKILPYLTYLSESTPQPVTSYEAPVTSQSDSVPVEQPVQAPAFVI